MISVVYTRSAGPQGLLLFALAITAVVVPIWAIAHAVSTPRSTFSSIGRSKTRWVAWLIVLFLLGDVTGFFVALYYVIRVRPRLNEVAFTR